jgi:hypothetical protein
MKPLEPFRQDMLVLSGLGQRNGQALATARAITRVLQRRI